MTLGLQGKIILLSVLSVTFISIITFLTILYFYHSQSIKTIDRNLEDDVNAVKQLLNFKNNGALDLAQHQSNAVTSYAKHTDIYYLVRGETLQPLRRSATMLNIEIPRAVNLEGYQYINFAGNEYRVLSHKYSQLEHPGNVDLYIQVLKPMQTLNGEVKQLFLLLLLMLPLPILLAGIGSWWIAKHTIQPIHSLIKTVETIDLESLDTNIPIIRNDEVGKLTKAFNTFLSRLNNAFISLQRFTADASHELRTPLTVIRTQAEVTLQKPRDNTEYQQNIVSTLEEISRLENLTDTLLQLTRADAGITKLSISEVNISKIIEKWVENLTPLADEKDINLNSNILNDVMSNVDNAVFECIIVNLLNNAIQYTPNNGKIHVQLTQNIKQIQLSIEDSGPGIPDTERQNIFDRFKRLQKTRHTSSGAGLGLSLVRWAATIHKGMVWVENSSLGGSNFIVTLPKIKLKTD